MENINNELFNKIDNYFDPFTNNYSSRELQSYLSTGNNKNNQQNMINQENYLSNNLQKKISQHRINNNGNVSNINIKNAKINNEIISKKIQNKDNDIINSYKKLNKSTK